MKYLVTDIEFDTDEDNVDPYLPNKIVIDVPDQYTEELEIDEYISDTISEITGFCHQ